ncbi:hypothetical protein C0J52_14826 [Blattella germanica]|nr:hypothetical protein C0J52_14826 [Blattella germanica]
MTRYLLFISYIGSQFRGVQKQAVSAEPSKLDAETIQGILEICSKRFNPANEPTVCVSSRTDKGVHALRSSAHVDLIRKSNLIYEPAYLAAGYNKQLAKLDLDLRHMQQFNISALKDAALLFPGSRDFRTFMGSKARLPEEVSTVKEMYSLDIVTGSPLLSPKYCPSAAYYDYWDVVCHAKSFLYRQVSGQEEKNTYKVYLITVQNQSMSCRSMCSET